MSWLYLPASVASSSVLKRQVVSELCATLSAIATQSKSSRPACKKGRSRTLRYGTTLPPLTGDRGAAMWISSLVASRVRTSQSQGGEQESQKERAPVFGPRCSESFAMFDPVTCSLKTSQLSLLGDSDEYSQTYPRAGTTRTGIAYQHEALAPLTGGIESSSWPTPSTMDTVSGRTQESQMIRHSLGLAEKVRWPTPTSRDHKDGSAKSCENVPVNALLGRAVHQPCPTPERGGSLIPQTYPTPRGEDSQCCGAHKGQPDSLHALAKIWATPKSSPSGPDYARAARAGSGGDDLATQTGGQLNPTWVEWLMGFPLGWTDLAVLATLSFHRRLTASDCESSHIGGGQDVADGDRSGLLRGSAQE